MMQQKLDLVFALKERLESVGIPSVVAGGCARDLANQIEPKDFDLFLNTYAEATALVNTVYEAGALSARLFPMYEHEASDRIKWVVKAVFPLDPNDLFTQYLEIDLISYHIENVEEATNHFDYNSNQWVILKVDGKYATQFVGEYHPRDGLVEIRSDMSERRRQYMQEKWSKLYG